MCANKAKFFMLGYESIYSIAFMKVIYNIGINVCLDERVPTKEALEKTKVIRQ
jgi:hypothetical protein